MDSKTIYLAYTTPDMEPLREELMFTLFKAGFKVLPMGEPDSNEETLKGKINMELAQCKSSIHLIGAEYGKTLASEGGLSLANYQYNKAKECLQKGHNFRIFDEKLKFGQTNI